MRLSVRRARRLRRRRGGERGTGCLSERRQKRNAAQSNK